MGAVLLITGKDLRQRLRDRSAILLALVLPLVLAFVYGLVFGGADVPSPFRYAVVDLDHGAAANAFRTNLLEPMRDKGIITVRRISTQRQAAAQARAGRIDAAFVLPSGLTTAVHGRSAATVRVIGNADAPTATSVATSMATAYTDRINSARTAVAAAGGAALTGRQRAELTAAVLSAQPPIALSDVTVRRHILGLKTYFAAAMAVFFLFFTVQFGVSSLIDEQANGTLERLLAMPIPRWAVLAGKLLTSLVLGLISMTALVVATTLLMGASWGSPPAVALLVVSGVLAATGVTALVAGLARTAEQAGSIQAILAMVLGLLGGVFFPVAQLGGAMETLSWISPHGWFLRGLGDLAGGGGVRAVLPAVGAMLAFAVVAGGIGVLRLTRAAAR